MIRSLLSRILRRRVDPAATTRIGRTWLGQELARINAPIELHNIDALVEWPFGRFASLTQKWRGRG